jgi:predicted phage-related endonuclease
MIDVTVDRHKYLGGSDIPIIMEISPFNTRFDLLLEKAELKENDFVGNEYTEYGNVMEPKIREHINKSLYPKNPFKEDTIIKDDLRGNFDGINNSAILEIKTTSQIYDNVEDYKVYLVQLLFYMQIAKKNKGVLAVYERPKDFNEELNLDNLQIFMVELSNNKELLEEINNAIDRFRSDLEKVKENPFITEEDLQPKEIVELSNEIVEIENQLLTFKDLETKQKKLKDNLKKAMEEYGIKKWTTPNDIKITLVADGEDKEVEVKKTDVEKFEKENGEIVKKYNDIKTEYEDKIKDYTIIEKEIKKGRAGYIKVTLPKE